MRPPLFPCRKATWRLGTVDQRVARSLAATVLAGVVICFGHANAQLPVIGLRSLSQSFFAPGGEYQVSIAEGDQTEEIRELVFSHPGITATLLTGSAKPFASTPEPRYGNFRVVISPEVPEGRYEARAVGRFGISNPRSILVQNGSHLVAAVGHDAASATPLALGELHHRTASPQQRDEYSISLDAGKTYTLELISPSVDSRLIGAISLINANGQTIHSVIGTDQSDLQFQFLTTQSGPVILEVHDALFRGGPAYQYGLRITDGDLITVGDPAERFAPVRQVNSVSARKLDGLTVAKSEPAMNLEIPSAFHSAFESPNDQDHYFCKLQKSAPVVLEVISERLGEPTDVRLVIERARDDDNGTRSWQRVATAEDSYNLSDSVMRLGTGDPVLRFQPPDDGDYRVTVTDLDTGRSLGETQQYQLAIVPAESQWHLLAYHVYPHKDPKTSRPSGTLVPRGGSTTIRVFVIRQQMTAPIRVSISDLPSGLNCRPAWIAANQNQTDLVITASTDATIQWAAIKVVGEADFDGRKETRTAGAACVTWEQDGYRPTSQTRLMDQLHISSTDLDVHPVSVDPAGDGVISAKKGTKVTVPIQVQRREGGNQNIVLRARNLPPGVKAGDLTIPADKSEAEWSIDVSGNTAAGTYTFWGQGETKVKFAVNPQSLATATEYRKNLDAMRADASRADDHAEIDQAIVEADKQIEAIKKQTAARDFTIYVPTSLITLEVL